MFLFNFPKTIDRRPYYFMFANEYLSRDECSSMLRYKIYSNHISVVIHFTLLFMSICALYASIERGKKPSILILPPLPSNDLFTTSSINYSLKRTTSDATRTIRNKIIFFKLNYNLNQTRVHFAPLIKLGQLKNHLLSCVNNSQWQHPKKSCVSISIMQYGNIIIQKNQINIILMILFCLFNTNKILHTSHTMD